MGRSKQSNEVNRFTGGLLTNANPLTQPANTTQEELNFLLHSDGSRSRRLGLRFPGVGTLDSTLQVTPTVGIA